MSRHKKKSLKLNSLFLWHRYLGLTAAFFVIILSVTGIMLNHSNQLGYVNKPVSNNLILDWYGIKAPKNITSFSTGKYWLSHWENQLYLNTNKIGNFKDSLIGVADLGHILIVAITNKIILLTHDGEIIEIMDSNNGVPSGIKKIGVDTSGRLIVNSAHGFYHADENLLTWHHINKSTIQFSSGKSLPIKLKNDIQEKFRQHSINYERVILDVHSGRIVGQWGIYIMDAAAVILILLSISGSSLWLIRIIKKRRHLNAHRKAVSRD